MEIVVQCEFCQKDIRGPRECKGEIVQRFCCDLCRFRFHNRRRLGIFDELKALLRKSGYLAEERRK